MEYQGVFCLDLPLVVDFYFWSFSFLPCSLSRESSRCVSSGRDVHAWTHVYFVAYHIRYLELARAEGHYSGTTAVCALVCNKGTSLVVANLGDSAAVLLRRRSSFPSEKSSSSSSSSASSSSSDGSGVSTSSSSSSSASSSSRGGSSSADPGSADPSQISTADRGPDSSRESSSSSSRNKTRSFAYEAVKLTEAHKPGAPAEQARVEAAGGWITEEKELFMGQLHRMDLDDPEIVSKVCVCTVYIQLV